MSLIRYTVAGVIGLVVLIGGGAHAQGPWREARYAHFSIFYEPGFEADARTVHGWVTDAERLMRSKYRVRPSHYRMDIYLYAQPTADVDINRARNVCCTTTADGLNVGRIAMLPPSAPAMRDSTQRSSLGMRKNDSSYQAKVSLSEYIPIRHVDVQNARPKGGWRYYDAPNWFVQGLQEYDAIFHTTERNRTEAAQHFLHWVRFHSMGFTCSSPDLAITDPYNGGAAFMAFLTEQFGEDVHRKLLASPAPTFSDALTAVTRPYTRPQLFARFQAWVRAPTLAGPESNQP